MPKVTVNKRGIYTKFSSAFCTIVGISTLAFLVFCQSSIIDFGDILFWIYLCMFPVFYIMISSTGNMLYRSEKLSAIKVFLLNDFVLYLILSIMILFIFVPLDDFLVGDYVDYIVLGVIGGFAYLLSLFMYLKLLIA